MAPASAGESKRLVVCTGNPTPSSQWDASCDAEEGREKAGWRDMISSCDHGERVARGGRTRKQWRLGSKPVGDQGQGTDYNTSPDCTSNQEVAAESPRPVVYLLVHMQYRKNHLSWHNDNSIRYEDVCDRES